MICQMNYFETFGTIFNLDGRAAISELVWIISNGTYMGKIFSCEFSTVLQIYLLKIFL